MSSTATNFFQTTIQEAHIPGSKPAYARGVRIVVNETHVEVMYLISF